MVHWLHANNKEDDMDNKYEVAARTIVAHGGADAVFGERVGRDYWKMYLALGYDETLLKEAVCDLSIKVVRG